MSVYTYVAIPMLSVAALMFYLARKRREKNFSDSWVSHACCWLRERSTRADYRLLSGRDF